MRAKIMPKIRLWTRIRYSMKPDLRADYKIRLYTGPPKPVLRGVQIFSYLTADNGPPDTLMINATHLKAHRTASSLLKGGYFPVTSGALKAA